MVVRLEKRPGIRELSSEGEHGKRMNPLDWMIYNTINMDFKSSESVFEKRFFLKKKPKSLLITELEVRFMYLKVHEAPGGTLRERERICLQDHVVRGQGGMTSDR